MWGCEVVSCCACLDVSWFFCSKANGASLRPLWLSPQSTRESRILHMLRRFLDHCPCKLFFCFFFLLVLYFYFWHLMCCCSKQWTHVRPSCWSLSNYSEHDDSTGHSLKQSAQAICWLGLQRSVLSRQLKHTPIERSVHVSIQPTKHLPCKQMLRAFQWLRC